MAQAMVNHYNYYQQRIQSLRLNGDILLQRIKMLEINMNQRKHQNLQPNPQHINSLNVMVKKLLQMLGEINTCQYFQLTNEPFNIVDFYFKQMCNRYYEDLIRQFIAKLRIRRIQRLQQLQRLNNIIHPIDFQIHK